MASVPSSIDACWARVAAPPACRNPSATCSWRSASAAASLIARSRASSVSRRHSPASESRRARSISGRSSRASSASRPDCSAPPASRCSADKAARPIATRARPKAARGGCNAAGSWSPELTPGLEVRKRKGHLVITDRYPGLVRHQLVELGYLKSAHVLTTDSVAFNIQPRRTGQALIGSSRQYGSEDKQVDALILRRMVARACEYMPRLKPLSAIRTWTGFRAATPDKLPLIGPSSGETNVYLATGHEGLGITTSLATATLLADQLLARPPAIPVEPYLPARARQESAHA